MHAVLNDMLVIELGTMVTAPLAGMMLGDMGARVIKVEQPETGDPFRGHGGGRYSPPFVAYNRGKQSIQLDLRSEDGLADLIRLLERADVVIENFRPGVMQRMGLDHARLRAINPRLVHASITGFGADGPYKGRPAYDSVPLALSGLSSLLLDPADPRMAGPTIADNVTGMYAVQGVLGALLRRDATGEGGHVEVNMLEAAISFIPDAFAQHSRAGIVSGPDTRVRISQAYALTCGDGRLLTVHMSSVKKFWEGLLKVIERPELASDERFATPVVRTRNYDALRALLGEIFATRPREAWMAALAAQEVPAAPVLSVDEVAADPQVAHLGTFATSEHPTMGQVVGIKSPITLDGARLDTLAPPPELGADHAAIAAEFDLHTR
ncbi:CaiB/BaiF CoA transferase family protein [Sphingomonas turrisvirgatae]|uniref:CoA-transferase n=1 Tax=Sphingomonas turrisvirgatae TaxID=1888892 RepID=A0A1E3LTU1_9SPHN|nr:CoA transferase [Sphingomonas turrisvirgatae]ODP37166.1 CoA-transferase [Sphingomonas turrisvirgatae]